MADAGEKKAGFPGLLLGKGSGSSLFALEVIVLFLGVVEGAGVLNGHLVTFLRLVDTIARLDDLARNSHRDGCSELQ